jgi:hypothetical protein
MREHHTLRQATSPIRRFQIANERLRAITNVDVFDAHKLRAPVPQSAQNLHLHCEHFHQTSGSGSECRCTSFRSKSVQPTQYGHCCSMTASHLDRERTLYFISGRSGLDHCKSAINRGLRDCAIW